MGRSTKISFEEAFQRKNGFERSFLPCLRLCLCRSCNKPTLWPDNKVPTNHEVSTNKVPTTNEVPSTNEIPSTNKVPSNQVSTNEVSTTNEVPTDDTSSWRISQVTL